MGVREGRPRTESAGRGQLVFSSVFQALDAALAGVGLGYVPEDLAEPHLVKGRLERALEEWCAPWPGYHLYYPSWRQSLPAFALLVEALRHRDALGVERRT
jgi:DNA-binding transcriptional LysR family regulator